MEIRPVQMLIKAMYPHQCLCVKQEKVVMDWRKPSKGHDETRNTHWHFKHNYIQKKEIKNY